MQKKTLLVAAMTASAALAGFVVAGSAFAADWHEYSGKMSAGQAYLIPVPKGADTLSFALVPTGEAPSAQIVVFDATDGRVGHFALAAGAESADLVDPMGGDYVVYVYELRQATLAARLQAVVPEDATLALAKAETVRADKAIVRDFEGGALTKQVVVNVDDEPVFATLLYQGQVENLNAIVESPKGIIMSITGESGVSYAPGLNVGAASAREPNLANLATGAFKVDVSADGFDGSLFLTTLTFERPEVPAPVEEPAKKAVKTPRAPKAPAEAPAPIEVAGAALARGVPTLVSVDRSTLALALPSYFECPAVPEDEEEDEDAHDHGDAPSTGEDEDEEMEPCMHAGNSKKRHGHGGHSPHVAQRVSIYDAEDNLVGTVVLNSKHPMRLVEELAEGEYVLWVNGYGYDEDAKAAAFLFDPEMPERALESRAIALVDGQFSLGRETQPLGYVEAAELVFETPPLALMAFAAPDTTAVDYKFTLENAKGVVASHEQPVSFPFGGGWYTSYSYDESLLVKGAYSLYVEALVYDGETTVHWVTYDRSLDFGETPEEEEVEVQEDGEPASFASPIEAVTSLVRRIL